LSDWAEGLLAQGVAKIHYELPARLMQELSQKEEASELIALATMPADDLARIPVRADFVAVVLDRPASPGNLGTIIRSCDALAAAGVIITGHAADLYDPETIRATTGSFFSVPAVRLPGHNELLPWLAELRRRRPALQVVGTSAKAPICIAAARLNRADGVIDRERESRLERELPGALRCDGNDPDARLGHIVECGLRHLHPAV